MPRRGRFEALQFVSADVGAFELALTGRALRHYQLAEARAIGRSVLARQGRTFTVMMARQMGKNELSAQLEAYLLFLHQRAGGTIVSPAGRADWGGTTGAFADPDGYVWEVAHNPGWKLDDQGAVTI